MSKSALGFTLVELLIVISIIAVLSVIGVTVFSGVQKSARDAKRRGDIDAIAKALEVYKSQNNTYTPAASLPCNSAFSAPFNSWNFGVVNSGWSGGCVTNIKVAWANSFASGIPQDPICNLNHCGSEPNNFSSDTDTLDYWFETTDGSSFTVSAHLENAPSPAVSGCHTGYNYCVKNQQ